jgi:hypothetical protein
VLRKALNGASVDRSEKVEAFRRLARIAHSPEPAR